MGMRQCDASVMKKHEAQTELQPGSALIHDAWEAQWLRLSCKGPKFSFQHTQGAHNHLELQSHTHGMGLEFQMVVSCLVYAGN